MTWGRAYPTRLCPVPVISVRDVAKILGLGDRSPKRAVKIEDFPITSKLRNFCLKFTYSGTFWDIFLKLIMLYESTR